MNLSSTLPPEAADHGAFDVPPPAPPAPPLEPALDAASARPARILYYLGGLTVVVALGILMELAQQNFGGKGVFLLAVLYAGISLGFTEFFLHRQHLPTAATMTATGVVILAAIAVYGVQVAFGWWKPEVRPDFFSLNVTSPTLWLELTVLASGIAMLWRYRLPFLVLPIVLMLCGLTIGLGETALHQLGWEETNHLMRNLLIGFGLLTVFAAMAVDARMRRRKDYALWLYVVGVLAFWGGLPESDDTLHKFAYLCIDLVITVLGALLLRGVLVLLGGLGVAGHLGTLAFDLLQDRLWFGLALTVIGIGIVCLGLLWQRYKVPIRSQLHARLPLPVQRLMDARV